MQVEFINTGGDDIKWIDAEGRVWLTKLSSNGQIPEQAQRWLKAGNTPVAFVIPPTPFAPLPRAAFRFMAKKLGLDDVAIKGLIARMPTTTQTEIDAKDLALFVYEDQQTFRRDNKLLESLVLLSPLTSAQVDTAWRQAELLKW